MQPATARDFLKVAAQRLMVAERIFKELGITLEAQYIGGYAVECALKALILECTPKFDRAVLLRRLTTGAWSHRKDELVDKLRRLNVSLSPRLIRRMRHFRWTTNLRYETGRLDAGETRALLRTATMVYDWVKGQIA